jgi:hypothetical protein
MPETPAMYADLLFGTAGIVAADKDVLRFEIPFRAFVLDEMAKGDLPFWNPHIMSGVPLFPNFGLLYPPNLLFLVLPLSKAINAYMALHLFLLGAFTLAWCRMRERSVPAAFMAGAVLMFSQTFFLRTFAGHLTVLAVFAWAPLVFLAVDLVFDRSALDGCLLGILAITMQMLTGYLPAVFCVAVAVGIYCGLRVIGLLARPGHLHADAFFGAVVALVAIAVIPLFTAAVQLWPSLQALKEVSRSQGVPLVFAQSHSYPPLNLLLLLAPAFFGTIGQDQGPGGVGR